MSALLQADKLSKTFHHRIGWWQSSARQVLCDVSFTLEESQTLAIMGSNGSGKSTLAALIAGAERPSSGQLLLRGTPMIDGDYKYRAQHIRMIFQDSEGSLNPNATIGQQLEEPLTFNTRLTHEQRDEHIARTLRRVGLLDEHRVFYPHMMSNGQRQRACIARAIILNPKVLVADEALATLDTSVRAQIINLLLDLQSELKMSYILVTHSPEIAHHMADQIMILRDGKVVECGSAPQVLSNPTSDYTRALVSSATSLPVEPLT